MNKKTVAYLDAHNERPTQKSGSGPAAKGSGPAADIAVVKAAALRIHKDSSIGSRERLTHLRSVADGLSTGFRDQELKQHLWDARRELVGSARPVPRGGQLKLSPARWLWKGVLMAGATTLVIALPKVGKSRLMTMALGRLKRGDDAFLGQAIPSSNPLFLIVGPDQTEHDWQECLHRAGLSDAKGNLDDSIVSLYSKSSPLHLDEAGIDQIAEYCRSSPNLVILLDSYSAATAGLGLEEKSAMYAEPLLDLQEAIAPYGASLIVIHHSNRHSAKGRASSASRGTTALPVAVSQTVNLSWCSDPEDNPLASADYRIKLTTEGRASRPLELFIEQVEEGFNWVSHGSASDVARKQKLEQMLQQLTERQQSALRDMAHHWLATNRGVDLVHLTHALGWERNRAKEVLDALLRKQFIKFENERPARGGGAGKPSKLYRPVDPVLPFFPLVPDQSDKSGPMSDKSG